MIYFTRFISLYTFCLCYTLKGLLQLLHFYINLEILCSTPSGSGHRRSIFLLNSPPLIRGLASSVSYAAAGANPELTQTFCFEVAIPLPDRMFFISELPISVGLLHGEALLDSVAIVNFDFTLFRVLLCELFQLCGSEPCI